MQPASEVKRVTQREPNPMQNYIVPAFFFAIFCTSSSLFFTNTRFYRIVSLRFLHVVPVAMCTVRNVCWACEKSWTERYSCVAASCKKKLCWVIRFRIMCWIPGWSNQYYLAQAYILQDCFLENDETHLWCAAHSEDWHKFNQPCSPSPIPPPFGVRDAYCLIFSGAVLVRSIGSEVLAKMYHVGCLSWPIFVLSCSRRCS